jgi:hypothetical protein
MGFHSREARLRRIGSRACAWASPLFDTSRHAFRACGVTTDLASRGLRDASNRNHRFQQAIRVLLPWLIPAHGALFVLATSCSIAAIVASGVISTIGASVALAVTFASQILERFSFFTAVTAPRMPVIRGQNKRIQVRFTSSGKFQFSKSPLFAGSTSSTAISPAFIASWIRC